MCVFRDRLDVKELVELTCPPLPVALDVAGQTVARLSKNLHRQVLADVRDELLQCCRSVCTVDTKLSTTWIT